MNVACKNPASNIALGFFTWYRDSELKSIVPRWTWTDRYSSSPSYHHIGCLARYEGGMVIDDIFLSTADSILYDRQENILRCTDRGYNKYGSRESDPLTMTLVHELMKKYGLHTNLSINDEIVYIKEVPFFEDVKSAFKVLHNRFQ